MGLTIDLLGSLMISCTEHDGRVTIRPYGGHEDLFRIDVPRVIALEPPSLQTESWDLGPTPSVTLVLPQPFRFFDEVLEASASAEARASLIIGLLQSVRRLGAVHGLSREGVLLDEAGGFHFTPCFRASLDSAASGLMWEGSEYKSYCIASAWPAVTNMVSRLTMARHQNEFDHGIEPLSKRCPPLAPLEPFLTEADPDFATRWWDAVAVIDDTLKSRR